MSDPRPVVKYPGTKAALDGNSAVIRCERESSDAAGAYPITPSTQMGEFWAEAAASGHLNISGRPLIFIEPEGEHAAAAVTAGLSMTGLRAANFSSGQGIAYMHESLYAAVGKRLTYVLNVGARAMTKATLNVHAGHDDYHCIDDTGFFQMFAKDAQTVADLNVIAHRVAELSLTPGVVAQDGFLTTHVIESVRVPERELIAEFLGRPDDMIETPTPAQAMIYGKRRRRIPELWSVDNSLMVGVVQNQDAYMQSVAAQRPFFFDHIPEIADRAFADYAALTGRGYARASGYRVDDAEYLLVGQGSMLGTAEAVADYLRDTRGIRVGVADLTMWRPFPADLLSRMLKGKKGVTVLERLDQPLAIELPIAREIRALISRCYENGRDGRSMPFPGLEAYRDVADAPAVYSASFGMGSRDLQPEGLIGAVENMLDDGPRQKFFYLSIDFIRPAATTPKRRLHQEAILDAYPHVGKLAVRGSENPNLMPPHSISVRLHSIGGWGAITTGKNLAMTLYDLLGYHIKANPKYGSEKKGQPTTFYLSAAPEPIRINHDYIHVDVVLSPDPNVFGHTNALAGLKRGGCFIIQSDHASPQAFWDSLPRSARQAIREQEIRLHTLDAFRIARDEASDPELRLRMQGIAFQGAFFAATSVADDAGLDEAHLIEAIRAQLARKFGSKGARVVEENLQVVKRGFDEVRRIDVSELNDPDESGKQSAEPALPMMLRGRPRNRTPIHDVHRFWEQTGSLYAGGRANDNLADPFMGLGTIPAVTTPFRDMTSIRFQYPEWIAENCTACGSCYTACPDTAIPGLVSEISAVFDTVVRRLEKGGKPVDLLRGAVRKLEPHYRELLRSADESADTRQLLDQAITTLVRQETTDGAAREALAGQFRAFTESLGDFRFALSQPYFGGPERQNGGSGGLLSITVNPYTCKGCMQCVEVCEDDALRPRDQDPAAIGRLRSEWDFWLDLPNTPERFLRIHSIEDAIGALQTLLLDKRNYSAFASGDGACLGCGEKTILHLFTATVEALMRPRVERHVAELTTLIERLERQIHDQLIHEIDLGQPELIAAAIATGDHHDLTLARIAEHYERATGGEPLDRTWLSRHLQLLGKLKQLKWNYTEGPGGQGRAAMGMLNATGCSSVWGSTFPYNPYPFPWANHLFQDSASLALGAFEGQMAKMADGFRAIREAKRALGDAADDESQDLTHFGWRDFTDEEWELCPPVVAVGGDGAMYDIGFQNLSRAMMSGMPIKVVVLDTQVYSNTGGQACTAGFYSQISDMAPFGPASPGKHEIRKEIALIAMAHRTTYVSQSTIAHPNHMIEGFIHGLKARRPALFNLYAPCQPEHGIGDDASTRQSKLAVESRAYPLLRYDPDAGPRPEEGLDLEGNPSPDQDWPTYELKYRDAGQDRAMTLPLTFADFAATEGRFRKHFRVAPPDTWNDRMVPLAEFLGLDPDRRDGRVAYIWSLGADRQLARLIVAPPMIEACEDRRDFWTMLRAMARSDRPECTRDAVAEEVRQEIAQRMVAGFANWLAALQGCEEGQGGVEAQGGMEGQRVEGPSLPPPRTATETRSAATETRSAAAHPPEASGRGQASPADAPAGSGGSAPMAPWIDSDRCTACDECIKTNPQIFAYDDRKKAYIKNPEGGPFSDLVKAAERCTAQIIHPGLPRDRRGKDIDRWIERAQRFN